MPKFGISFQFASLNIIQNPIHKTSFRSKISSEGSIFVKNKTKAKNKNKQTNKQKQKQNKSKTTTTITAAAAAAATTTTTEQQQFSKWVVPKFGSDLFYKQAPIFDPSRCSSIYPNQSQTKVEFPGPEHAPFPNFAFFTLKTSN